MGADRRSGWCGWLRAAGLGAGLVLAAAAGSVAQAQPVPVGELQSRVAMDEPEPAAPAQGAAATTAPARPQAATSTLPPGVRPVPDCPVPGRPRPPAPPTGPQRTPIPRTPDPKLMIGAGGALGVLNLPNIALGPALFTQVGLTWPLEIAVSYLPPNRAEVPDGKLDLGIHPLFYVPFPDGGSRLKLSLAQASVATCPLRHHLTSGRLLGCAGLYGGMLHAEPEGLIASSSKSRLLAGAELYARWYFPIGGPIGLTYSAGLFLPFLRESFGYRDRAGEYQRLFREPALGGRLDIFLVYALQ